jgi:hypothetical protein
VEDERDQAACTTHATRHDRATEAALFFDVRNACGGLSHRVGCEQRTPSKHARGLAGDALARSLAGVRTRRGLLRALGLAVGVGAVGAIALDGDGDAAATCRPGGAVCRTPGECCSGVCGPKDATGRQRCTCEAGTTPCGTSACCSASQTCVNGACRQPTPTATSTTTPITTPTNTPLPDQCPCVSSSCPNFTCDACLGTPAYCNSCTNHPNYCDACVGDLFFYCNHCFGHTYYCETCVGDSVYCFKCQSHPDFCAECSNSPNPDYCIICPNGTGC